MVRPELLRQGVPPDQVEAQLNAVVAKAQLGVNPFYPAPEPPKQPPPGFAEGFADRWFSTEQSIKNLFGQGGLGAPGVLESWGGMLQGTAESLAARIWPGNNGFPPGYEPQPATLPAGTIIDRFGGEGGRYLA